jgi:hypothetical protein
MMAFPNVDWPDAFFEFLAPDLRKASRVIAVHFRSEVSYMLYLLLFFVSLAITALSFWQYRTSGGSAVWLVGMILFLLATVAFGGLFLSGRVNRTDDIHITE